MTAEKELGLRVRGQRKRLLLTQDELAEKAGLSIQHVGDIERGQANPTFACLCRLAEVMGVNVACFFVDHEEISIFELQNNLELSKPDGIISHVFSLSI